MIIQKRISISLFITVAFFSAPLYSFAQNNSFPFAATGPDAALDFYEGFTGAPSYVQNEIGRRVRIYPQGQHIPLEELTNITQLHENFYHPKAVLDDFEKTREPDQLCALVMVKTEECRKGPRMCAVATAVLEKESTPILSRFKIYGIRVPPNSFDKKTRKEVITGTDWEKTIKKLYEFKQGPGARLVAVCNGMMIGVGGAGDLGLSDDEFRRNRGTTPQLEKSLQNALTQLLPHAPPPPLTPRISVSDDPRIPRNATEADAWIKKRKKEKEKRSGLENKPASGSFGAHTLHQPSGAGAVTEENFEKASVKMVTYNGRATDQGSATIIGCSPILNQDGQRNCLLVTVGHLYDKNSNSIPMQPGFVKRVGYELASREGYIELPHGVRKRVYFIGGDLKKDFALAGFTVNADETVSTASLAPRGLSVVPGDTVIQAGYPHGGTQVLRQRIVKAIDFPIGSHNIICHHTMSSGASGGGLLKLSDGLVGICSMSDKEENQTFFVNTQVLYDFVDGHPEIQSELKGRSLYNFIFSP